MNTGAAVLPRLISLPSLALVFFAVAASIADTKDSPRPDSDAAYSTTFDRDENPLSDGGKWNHNGLDWAKIRVKDGVAIGTQSGESSGDQRYDDSYAHLSGFPPDQEASGKVYIAKPDPQCHQEVEILLRWTSSAHNTTGYECFARCLSGESSYLQIVRWEGPLGKFTYLADKRGAVYGLKDGDTLKASIIGNVIRVYVNDVEKATVTDNTHKTGSPGIGEFLQCDGHHGVGSNATYGFKSFSAKGIAGGVTKPVASTVPTAPDNPNAERESGSKALFGNPGAANARTIVFVFENTGSMINKIAQPKVELSRAVEKLRPDQSFDIIYPQGDRASELDPHLIPATPENKHKAEEPVKTAASSNGCDSMTSMRTSDAGWCRLLPPSCHAPQLARRGGFHVSESRSPFIPVQHDLQPRAETEAGPFADIAEPAGPGGESVLLNPFRHEQHIRRTPAAKLAEQRMDFCDVPLFRHDKLQLKIRTCID
jgi:hypothetical protein